MGELIVVFGFLLELGTLIAAAVWGVSRIKGSTNTLSSTIETLSGSITRLERIIERLDTKVDGHGERLARIEALSDRQTG